MEIRNAIPPVAFDRFLFATNAGGRFFFFGVDSKDRPDKSISRENRCRADCMDFSSGRVTLASRISTGLKRLAFRFPERLQPSRRCRSFLRERGKLCQVSGECVNLIS